MDFQRIDELVELLNVALDEENEDQIELLAHEIEELQAEARLYNITVNAITA